MLRSRPLSIRPTLGVLCVLMLVGHARVVLAQDVTEVSLKAAFLFNFAKFTEWPVDVLPAKEALVGCVVGDPAVGEALERAVAGRMVGAHKFTVTIAPPEAALRSCHLLYISGMGVRQATQLIAGLKNAPILTVSDLDEFARQGGVAQLFVENGKMRFGINLASAKRSRLQLSSKLLVLARMMDDGPPRIGVLEPHDTRHLLVTAAATVPDIAAGGPWFPLVNRRRRS